jgi:hypothetical protein
MVLASPVDTACRPALSLSVAGLVPVTGLRW